MHLKNISSKGWANNMAKLIRFEFRKLLQNKAFYICVAISLAMTIIITLTYKAFTDLIAQAAEETGTLVPSTNYTSFVLLKSSFNNGYVAMIGGVMTALLVSEDYTNDLTKNIYSKGYSREQLYLSKYIVCLVAFVVLMIIGMIASFFFGFALDGLGEMGDNYFLSILGIVFVGLAYYTIFFGIAILLKKTGGAIAISIIGPTVISLLLTMGDTFINLDNFKMSEYWLDNRVLLLAQDNVEVKTFVVTLIISLVLIVAMIIPSFLVNRKRDN